MDISYDIKAYASSKKIMANNCDNKAVNIASLSLGLSSTNTSLNFYFFKYFTVIEISH
jgi:hypothetical protein